MKVAVLPGLATTIITKNADFIIHSISQIYAKNVGNALRNRRISYGCFHRHSVNAKLHCIEMKFPLNSDIKGYSSIIIFIIKHHTIK